MLIETSVVDPTVPVPAPPPVVLDVGTTPDIVPCSWLDAMAADQLPPGPTVATFEYAVTNWLELAAHCPFSEAVHPPALEGPWNFIEILPLIVGVAELVAAQVDALACADRADAIDAVGSTTSELTSRTKPTARPTWRRRTDFIFPPLAPDVFWRDEEGYLTW